KVSSVIDAIFAFCVLYFISDTSLFYKILLTAQSQQILFYSEVSFFLNHLSWDSLYLNYTGSSLSIFIHFSDYRSNVFFPLRFLPACRRRADLLACPF